MRILIDFTQIPIKRTGAGVYAENLVRELVQVLKPDARLFLLLQSDEVILRQVLESEKNVQILSIPSPLFRNRLALMLFEQFILPWIVLCHKIDTLHSLHYTIPLWVPAARIVTFHDLTHLLWPHLHTRGRRFIMPLYLRLAWRLADSILFVSDSTRRDAERLLHPRRKLTAVTPLGVDFEKFHQTDDPERMRNLLTRLGAQPPYFLFVGTVEPRKNVLRLIQAFEAIAEEFPDCRLVIAGKIGWHADAVVRAMESSPFRHRIHQTGYISDHEKQVLLTGCTALVYPSLYEGFGLPVLEGMAAGVPVITSNISSLPEVAGHSALLVDPASVEEISSAMRAFLQNAGLAEEYRKLGPERARLFTWRRTAEATYNAYQLVSSGTMPDSANRQA